MWTQSNFILRSIKLFYFPSTDPIEFSMDSEVTSAALLKELLLLQKTRQLEKTAEPPPDIVIGTQVSTTKPVTTAEALRTKVWASFIQRSRRLVAFMSLPWL